MKLRQHLLVGVATSEKHIAERGLLEVHGYLITKSTDKKESYNAQIFLQQKVSKAQLGKASDVTTVEPDPDRCATD